MSNRMGWECPKCGRVMAPFVTECPNCGKSASVWVDKLTTTNPNKLENTVTAAPGSFKTEPLVVKTDASCAPSKSESECKCHKDKRLNEVVDSIIEPTVMIRKIDENGNIVDKENMTKDELKKIDSILETVLGS